MERFSIGLEVRLLKDLFELLSRVVRKQEEVERSIGRARTTLYQAKPKLEPSCPLATIVNCRTASRVRLIDREPLVAVWGKRVLIGPYK
jgi:hypothetical protein